MPKPNVLIVGAGALGIVTGYHLALGGAAITFLVRPARLDKLQAPQVLYCFDDGQLKHFTDYQAVGSVADAAKQNYDFVLVTLDGAACKSDEGTRLLRELGDTLRETSAVVILCGIGALAHCRDALRLPEHRLAQGTMGIYSYQVDQVTMPLHPPTDPQRLAQASLAYRHSSGKTGFMMAGKPAKAAKAFAALYNRCGISHCSVVPAKAYTAFTSSFFPIVALFDLAGWPDANTMAANRELMSLASGAMKEIMRLPEHGWPGLLASLFFSPKALAANTRKTERNTLPMDYVGFLKFHHGGKVREQNLQLLRQCAASGKAQGKAMPALTEILRRYEAHCAA